MTNRLLCATLLLLSASAAAAQDAPPAAPTAPAPTPPRLIVTIAVDQLSADLFAEFRQHFTGGLRRMSEGVVFPSGFQGHAATETCPGHATILTGVRPARSGIIANDWIDPAAPRADKTVYCVEDERVPGTSSKAGEYRVSPYHLQVKTLGERMKMANPAARNVVVAGKDRAAVTLGGANVDEIWWLDPADPRRLQSYQGRTVPPAVARANAAIATRVDRGQTPLSLPPLCAARSRGVAVPPVGEVGAGRFARAAGDARGFRASPASDGALLALAAALIQDMKLGQGAATDSIAIGASATDYVGHSYGTHGTEMCLQLLSLDRDLGAFFDVLDRAGIDYMVALTADHGGHDAPERLRAAAIPGAQRVAETLTATKVGEAIQRQLGLAANPLMGGSVGNMLIDRSLSRAQRAAVLKAALAAFAAHPDVEAAYSAEEIMATPLPADPPDAWTLIERVRASFSLGRSGDFYIILKPRVTPIAPPRPGIIATHGSAWDYDRRVPILFWRRGLMGYEQPLAVETIDIAPTLAALIGLSVPAGAMDGRCLDLDPGPASTCP